MKKVLFAVAFAMFSATGFAQSAPTATLTFDFQPTDVVTYAVTGFDVQRKAEACAATALTFAPLATAPAAGSAVSRTYIDTTVAAGKTYCFRVRALAPVTATNQQGNSGFSNTAEKTIPFPTIPVPQNLLVTFLTAMIEALEQFKIGLQTPQ